MNTQHNLQSPKEPETKQGVTFPGKIFLAIIACGFIAMVLRIAGIF